MSTNLMYTLGQDGVISSSFPVQSNVQNIQDLIVELNWEELLVKREHRIIDSIRLSKKAHMADRGFNVTWRMELFPLEGKDKNAPAFNCLITSLDVLEVDAKKKNFTNIKTILDMLPFGVAVIRRDKRVYIMNQAALDLAGYSNLEEFSALQRPCQDTFCPAPKGQCPIWDKGQRFDKTERGFLMRDGTAIQVLKSAVQVQIEGETMMLEGIIDLRKQKDLEHLAYSDPLTGVLNRKGLRDKFTYVSDQLESRTQNYSVMMFDLDGFKQINDTYGHFAGDNVLRFFVQCVNKELQLDSVFCRWGGDEFLVITSLDISECLLMVQRIIDNAKVVPYKNEEWSDLSPCFSVGLAAIKRGMTLNEAVHMADGYMYRAKRGHLGVCFEEMDV